MSKQWKIILPYHDGEQLRFYKKVRIKTYRLRKKKNILATPCIARNEEFQFVYLTKTVIKITSNAILILKKIDLDEL